MTERLFTIGPQASAGAAAALMARCRVRHLPVVESAALAGVLSLRDTIGSDESTVVAAIMSPAETVPPSESIARACETMLRRRFSCAPVVYGNQLIGIVTATDMLRAAADLLDEEARGRRAEQKVHDLMSHAPVSTIAPNAPLSAAWRLMQAERIRHLPVVRDERLVGILSDRDLLAVGRRLLAEETPALVVADAMTAEVHTIAADRPAAEAAGRLLRLRIGALPVLRGAALRGIISVADFMYYLLSRV